MAWLASHPRLYRHELENELCTPQARLVQGEYALGPLTYSQRVHSDRPLSHYISGDSALEAHYVLRHRPILGEAGGVAVIDRDGPFRLSSYNPRFRSLPHLDAEYLDMSDPNRRFPYSYPLPCMDTGGIRWSPGQIHAYNLEVLRHNNQIGRRRTVGESGEYMMLYPMMDPLGRLPPGFDRPRRIEEYLALDGKRHCHLLFECRMSTVLSSLCCLHILCYVQHLLICSVEPLIDSHHQHYGLRHPENLERLLLLNSAEHRLRRELKQIQLLQLHGAERLAEQFAMQLLAAQNFLPGVGTPRSLGYGLGPDFDNFLNPLTRDYDGMIPLEALGYGNGLANWNFDMLPQFRAATAGGDGRGLGPWGGPEVTNPFARTGMYPSMGMNRGYGFPGSFPGLLYGGGPWGGSMGGFGPRSMGMDGGPSNYGRLIERISCDGGGGNRAKRFNSS